MAANEQQQKKQNILSPGHKDEEQWRKSFHLPFDASDDKTKPYRSVSRQSVSRAAIRSLVTRLGSLVSGTAWLCYGPLRSALGRPAQREAWTKISIRLLVAALARRRDGGINPVRSVTTQHLVLFVFLCVL